MELIFDISLHILVIWGAMCIILMFIICLKLFLILTKINYLLSDIQKNYKLMKNFFFMPLSSIRKFFKK